MKERICGVDLAKSVAIFLVVLFHTLTCAESTPKTGFAFYWGTYLTALASCCVDLFGLVSGYLGVTGSPAFRKWGRLWLQVFVINASMTLVSHFVFGAKLQGIDVTHALLPVTSSAYWYFTAYTGLYCLMPILNRGLLALDRRQALGTAAAIFAVCSVSASVGQRDVYGHFNGYSVLWLTALYVFGGVIRLHLTKLPKVRWCLLAALALPVLTLLQTVVLLKCPSLAAKLEGRPLAGHYLSPVILLTAVALFCAMLRFRPASERVRRTVAYFSMTSFGIYLIHDQFTFHYGVWGASLHGLADMGATRPALWTAGVVGTAVAAYVAFSVLEWARQEIGRRLFRKPPQRSR